MAEFEHVDFVPADLSSILIPPLARLAQEEGAPVDLALRIFNRGERSGPSSVSPQDAYGTAQIKKTTFQQYAKPTESFGNDEHRTRAALRKIKDDYAHFGGDEDKTAAAYIGGRGAIRGGQIRADVSDALGTTPAAYAERVNRGERISQELQPRRLQSVGFVPSAQPTEAQVVPDSEKTVGIVGAAGRGLTHGTFGLAEAVNLGLQFIGNRIGSQSLAERGESGAQYWAEKAKPFEPPGDIQGSIVENPALLAKGTWWAYNFFDTLPSLAASIIPGYGAMKAIRVAGHLIPLTEKVVERLAIAGGAMVGGVAGGSLEGAQTYQEVLKRGGSEPEAAVAGSAMALASGVLNSLAVGKIISPAKAGALRKFLVGGTAEALTEWAEEPTEGAILSRTSVARPGDAPLQRAIQGANVAPIAFVLGGGAGAIMPNAPEAPQNVPPGQPAPITPPIAQPPAGGPPIPPTAPPQPTPTPEPTGFPELNLEQRLDAALAPAAVIEPLPPTALPKLVQPIPVTEVLPLTAPETTGEALTRTYGEENPAVRHVVQGGMENLGEAMLRVAPLVEQAQEAQRRNRAFEILQEREAARKKKAKEKAFARAKQSAEARRALEETLARLKVSEPKQKTAIELALEKAKPLKGQKPAKPQAVVPEEAPKRPINRGKQVAAELIRKEEPRPAEPVVPQKVAPPAAPKPPSANRGKQIALERETKARLNAQRERTAVALKNPEIQASVRGFRGQIGRAEAGGRLIVDETTRAQVPGGGDVLGRTVHVGHRWWFDRPDPNLSAYHARKAIDKAMEGKPLRNREQRFVNYVVEMVLKEDAENAQMAADGAALIEQIDNAIGGDWGNMSGEQQNAELNAIFGPETPEEGEGVAAGETPPVAPVGDAEARPEVPAEVAPLELAGQPAAELTPEAEARAAKEREAREGRAIADREREAFALQPPGGIVRAQPLAEPKNQQGLPLSPPDLKQPSIPYTPEAAEHIYDNLEVRPGTTSQQRSLGIAALKGLLDRDRRAGATLLASSLWRDFQEGRGADLIGATAGNAHEVATVTQVLRDPRFETLRFFFTRGKDVVGHSGQTSRLPGQVAFAKTWPAVDVRIAELRETMERLGADGYWMVHNHPNGSALPSDADVDLTRGIAQKLNGLRGHVVIDRDHYTVINSAGNVATHDIQSPQTQIPELPHDLLGRVIKDASTLAEVVRELQAPAGFATLVSTDSIGRVTAIGEVPDSILTAKTPGQELKALARVRRFGRMTGSPNRIFVVSDRATDLDYLVINGVAIDVATYDGNSSRATRLMEQVRGGYWNRPRTRELKSGILEAQQSTAPYEEPTLAGQIQSSGRIGRFIQTVSSPASLGKLNAFLTQYHKAVMLKRAGKPEYKQVWDKLQDYEGDVSGLAVQAESLAPMIFSEIKSLSPKLAYRQFKAAASEAEIKAVAPWLYHGTLYGDSPMEGVVWTDEELRGHESIERPLPVGMTPLTEKGIKIYRQARLAIDRSLDDHAKALIFGHARREGFTIDRDMSLNDIVTILQDRIDERLDELLLRREAGFDPQKTIQNLEALRGTVGEIAQRATGLKEHGYMPLMRFGTRTVTAKDADGNVRFFGMYEGNRFIAKSADIEMNQAKAELERLHPDWKVSANIRSERAWKLYSGLSLDALQNFLDLLDPDTQLLINKDIVAQEYFRNAANNHSVLKRMIHRKGTPGFSTDVPRTLAAFITSNARNSASIYHIAEANRIAQNITEGDIQDEAVNLIEFTTEPGEQAALIRSFLFSFYLGGSIAAAAVNMSQTLMMTAPYLAQYTSLGKLTAKLLSAAKTAVRDPATLTDASGRALQKAEAEGVTAPQQIYHLMAIAANNPLMSQRKFRSAMTLWNGMFGSVEVFNRRVAFKAAYEIATEMGGTRLDELGFENAYDFAKDAVAQTQGIYSKSTRMNFTRWGGGAGAIIGTFKQFPVMYLELFRRLPPQQQLLMMGLLLLVAGLEGLPFAEDIEDTVDTLGQWLGFTTNTGKWIGKTVRQNLGEEFERPLLKGIGGMLPLDLHARLGFPNLLPGTAFFKPSEIEKSRDVADAVGPIGSVLQNFALSLQLLAQGRWDKAAVANAPKAVKDAYNGFHMLTTSESQDIKGRLMMRDVTGAEAAGKAIGFNPQRMARESEVRREEMVGRNLRRVRLDEYATQWAEGIVRGDQVDVRGALEKWLAWNRNNPELAIDLNSMTRSVRERVLGMRRTSQERFIRSAPKAMRQQTQEAFR